MSGMEKPEGKAERSALRVLVVIPHYCGAVSGRASGHTYGSQAVVAPRAFALNEQLCSLYRNFGPHRFAGPQTAMTKVMSCPPVLDIVIATMKGRNVLDLIDVDPSMYQVEYYDGDPLMLSFETQRIARERKGGYDLYAMLEDDLIVHDPAFLDKILWFVDTFGVNSVLQPQRVEVSRAGHLGKSLIEPPLPKLHAEFEHHAAPETVRGQFGRGEISFSKTSNPHSGCWFLTAAQFEDWCKAPYFYDRNPGWVGPLESAATRALAMSHAVYRAGAPDPFFLEVEHYGVRFANSHAKNGFRFRPSPFAALPVRTLAPRVNAEALAAVDALQSDLFAMRTEVQQLRRRLGSRSGLARQLLFSVLTKKINMTVPDAVRRRVVRDSLVNGRN